MSTNLSPVGGAAAQFLDNNGNPLTGGKLFTYAAGTTTPQATFTTFAGNVAHANPIILDAAGRVPGGEIWLTVGANYKFSLFTSANVLIATWDNIVGIDGMDFAIVAGGTSSAATVAVNNSYLQSGSWFRILMTNNSDFGITLNGKAIKVLDVYATEQSQWTITNPSVATKNKPKVDVYRTVCQNLLSADVPYMFRYIANLDIYQVIVTEVYKHVFIPCGNGKEIAELQDALTFASQFRIASYMDPIYMNVEASTDYYPLKGQISVAVVSGTTASPITSVMTKVVRIGENNLNGVEIVNENRYTNSMDTGGCIVDFQVTLGNDDLACLNVWKTDLGEVRGITFKFAGTFTLTNQAVIGYWNTQDRFKQCVIDVTGATVSGGVTAYAMNSNSIGETNSITINCPTTLTTGLTAIWTGHSVSGLTVTGRPQTIIRYSGDVDIFGVSATDGGSTYALSSNQAGEIYLRSGTLSAQNLFPPGQTPQIKVSTAGFTLTLANRNNKWVNKVDNLGAFVVIPSLGRVTANWNTTNTITVTAGDTAVSLEDGQFNRLFITSGNADIDTINLDIGDYTFAQTGENNVVQLQVVKLGSGTINLVTGGNINPNNAGTPVALTNNEPITLIYEPVAARWMILR
jgi:hypothetical protein